MATEVPKFPDSVALTVGLTSVFGGKATTGQRVTILDRQANAYASTFPSEVVTCRLRDGMHVRLLCKYSSRLAFKTYGHPGGIEYEAAVYRHILGPTGVSTPKFYGSYTDPVSGDRWLVLEYLGDGRRLDETPEPDAAMRAARWAARFHANTEKSAPETSAALTRYDSGYYLGWVRRALSFARELEQCRTWLPTLCERFGRPLEVLLAVPRSVIHGDLYPHNILIRDGTVYAVDWEAAAWAAGEIDLAALTDRWPDEFVRPCELEYRRVRWPAGEAHDFDRTLDSARLYWLFRWLGTKRGWTRHARFRSRIEQLRSVGERLELI